MRAHLHTFPWLAHCCGTPRRFLPRTSCCPAALFRYRRWFELESSEMLAAPARTEGPRGRARWTPYEDIEGSTWSIYIYIYLNCFLNVYIYININLYTLVKKQVYPKLGYSKIQWFQSNLSNEYGCFFGVCMNANILTMVCVNIHGKPAMKTRWKWKYTEKPLFV